MPLIEQITITYDDSPDFVDPLQESLITLLNQKTSKEKFYDPYSYEEEVIIEKPKKAKKKKKKKKEKGLIDKIGIDIISNGEYVEDKYTNMIEEDLQDDEDVNQIDPDAVFNEYEDDEEDDIIWEQRTSYKQNKKDTNNYKKEFAEEFALIYSLLNETKTFGTSLDKLYKEMSGKRFSKYTTDIILSINNNKQLKLQILKEAASLKAKIADLSLKDAKAAGKDDGGSSVENLAASYLSSIIKHGRNKFVSSMNEGSVDDMMDDISSTNYDDYSDDDIDNMNDKLKEDLDDDDDNSYRSAQADAYVRFESLDVKIHIKRDVGSGEWSFTAIDKYGNELFDYPLPDRDRCSPIKFTADGSYGQDKLGRSYKVIESY